MAKGLLLGWHCSAENHGTFKFIDTVPCMQAAEAEKKAAAAQAKAADGPQLEHDEEDDLDPNQYHERRLRALETARASGRNPYPHKFHLTMYIPEYVAKYRGLEPGTKQEQTRESLAGKSEDSPPISLTSVLNPVLVSVYNTAARHACTRLMFKGLTSVYQP